MTRVLVRGSAVAIGCGALLGFAVAYQLVLLTVLAALLGLAGTFVAVRATPGPATEPGDPVTLSGPIARAADDEESASEPVRDPAEQLSVPVVAAVPDAA
jgi:hypothetical protein